MTGTLLRCLGISVSSLVAAVVIMVPKIVEVEEVSVFLGKLIKSTKVFISSVSGSKNSITSEEENEEKKKKDLKENGSIGGSSNASYSVQENVPIKFHSYHVAGSENGAETNEDNEDQMLAYPLAFDEEQLFTCINNTDTDAGADGQLTTATRAIPGQDIVSEFKGTDSDKDGDDAP